MSVLRLWCRTCTQPFSRICLFFLLSLMNFSFLAVVFISISSTSSYFFPFLIKLFVITIDLIIYSHCLFCFVRFVFEPKANCSENYTVPDLSVFTMSRVPITLMSCSFHVLVVWYIDHYISSSFDVLYITYPHPPPPWLSPFWLA